VDKSGSVPLAKQIDMLDYYADIVTGKPYAMVKDGRLFFLVMNRKGPIL